MKCTPPNTAKSYISAKQVIAWPSTRTITNSTHSEGTVEPGYSCQCEDGHTRWMSKAEFEATYQPADVEGRVPVEAVTKCAHKLAPYSDYYAGHKCDLCGVVVGGRR